MKENRFILVVAVLILILETLGCAPSNEQIQRAIAQTITATPYPTQTPYPTATTHPTEAPSPTATVTPTVTSEYRSLTWAQLIDFILNDHTNWNVWTEEYNCVNFSMDLVTNTQSQNMVAWMVAVTFSDHPEGHVFVAFPTSDSDVIWIEPQTDDAYFMSQVGEPLCLVNNPRLCWSMGTITQIIYPAECDRVAHNCWLGTK